MINSKIKFGLANKPRNSRTQITIKQFFEGVKTGKWREQVERLRSIPESKRHNGHDPYKKLKSQLPAVWLQELGLVSIDWEDRPIDLDSKYILAHGKSSGGIGNFVVTIIPDKIGRENWSEYRRELFRYLNIESSEGQISNDRCRYVSYDPELVINPKAVAFDFEYLKPDEQHSEYSDNNASELYADAKSGAIVLDNQSGMSVYYHLRYQSISHDATVEEMEQLPWKDSGSMSTRKGREKYYSKWNSQYEVPPAIKQFKKPSVKQKIVVDAEEPIEQEDFYCTDDEQIDAIVQTVVAPFLPLQLEYFNAVKPVSLGTVLVGDAGSGKGQIDKIVKPLVKMIQEIDYDLTEYIIGETKIKNMDDNDKQIRKLIPNIVPVTGFDSSDAAVFGSLSECNRMLMYGNEIGNLIGSARAEHNASRIGNILSFLEGESTTKVLKKNELYGKTKFFINDPVFSLMAGGTPDTVTKFFAKNLENGLVSRMLFMYLRPTDITKDKQFKKVSLTDYLTSDMILETLTGKKSPITATYSIKHIGKIKQQLHDRWNGTPVYGTLNRSLKYMLNRAAVQMWIDGNRKSFQIPNEYIDDQLRLLDKSLNYISTFTEYSTDRFGNNNLGQVLKEKTDIGLGKSVEVRRGVSITREQANQIKKLYLKFNKNVTEVAKFLGVSRPTIYKALKIE